MLNFKFGSKPPDPRLDFLTNPPPKLQLDVEKEPKMMPQPIEEKIKVFCLKHKEKEIEYFCKICHSIVCAWCMFVEHNGHELAMLEDVTGIIW